MSLSSLASLDFTSQPLLYVFHKERVNFIKHEVYLASVGNVRP